MRLARTGTGNRTNSINRGRLKKSTFIVVTQRIQRTLTGKTQIEVTTSKHITDAQGNTGSTKELIALRAKRSLQAPAKAIIASSRSRIWCMSYDRLSMSQCFAMCTDLAWARCAGSNSALRCCPTATQGVRRATPSHIRPRQCWLTTNGKTTEKASYAQLIVHMRLARTGTGNRTSSINRSRLKQSTFIVVTQRIQRSLTGKRKNMSQQVNT